MGEVKEGVRLYHFPLRSGVVGGRDSEKRLPRSTHARTFPASFPSKPLLPMMETKFPRMCVCAPVCVTVTVKSGSRKSDRK